MDQQMQLISPPKESSTKTPDSKIFIAIIALIFIGSGYCFSQSNNTVPTMKKNIGQEERIAALEKRITEAGDDFVSLTLEEYDILLSQPIGTVDGFKPLTTTAGGIMIGTGVAGNGVQQVIQTIFQKIPNIGEGDAG